MKTLIKLNDFDEVSKFVKQISRLSAPVTLEQCHLRMDAKSILGAQTLNLNLPIKVEIDRASSDERIKFKQICSYYEVH